MCVCDWVYTDIWKIKSNPLTVVIQGVMLNSGGGLNRILSFYFINVNVT